MKSTRMFEAKRALFDAMRAQTGVGQPLEGIQVAYSWPGRDVMPVCIYGGGMRMVQDQTQGGVAEFRVVILETVAIGVYVRVLRKDTMIADVEAVDVDCEAIADKISNILTAQPKLAGNLTWLGFEAGTADYGETADGPEAILGLQVQVQALLT
jgi:hypothetical protein